MKGPIIFIISLYMTLISSQQQSNSPLFLSFHPRNGGAILSPDAGSKCANSSIKEVIGWTEFEVLNGHVTQVAFVVDNVPYVCSAKTGSNANNKCYKVAFEGNDPLQGFTARLTEHSSALNVRPRLNAVDVWRSTVDDVGDFQIVKRQNVNLDDSTVTPIFDIGRVQVSESKYWIAGGKVYTKIQNEDASKSYQMELKDSFLFENGEWKNGPELPEPLQKFCMAAISDTKTLIAGGSVRDSPVFKAWIYDWNTQEFTPTTPLPFPLASGRSGYCSRLNDAGDVVTASGIIYRVATAEWVDYEYDEQLNGPIFYLGNNGGAYLVDSNNVEFRLESNNYGVYKFDEISNKWKILDNVVSPRVPFEYLIGEIKAQQLVPACQ